MFIKFLRRMNSAVLMTLFVCTAVCHELTVKIDQQEQSKMPLLIGVVGQNAALMNVAKIIKTDLQRAQEKLTGFDVALEQFERVHSKSAIKQFCTQGYSLIVYLNILNDNTIEWRIYDAAQAAMLKGRRMIQQLSVGNAVWLAHAIADQIWLELTGNTGIFSTHIAYCKERVVKKKSFKDIFITDINGSDHRLLVKGGKLLAPRWNRDMQHPLLLYSECTPYNVRLMSANMQGKRSLVSNFDGLNMLPSFSSDGLKVVYCSSARGSSQVYVYDYDEAQHKGYFRNVTKNNGNNVSPTLLDNGDIIFCSDYQTGAPQIYYYTAATKDFTRLTAGGYCASPCYCDKNGKVAYCKLIGNTMQLFIYDLKTKEHIQITNDEGNKDECTWSPCGNYLAFSLEKDASSAIAVMNVYTKERFLLTGPDAQCSYPSWSPLYEVDLISK